MNMHKCLWILTLENRLVVLKLIDVFSSTKSLLA